jgi:hypothetical protein
MAKKDKTTFMHLRVEEKSWGHVDINCYLTEGDRMNKKLFSRIYSALKEIEDDINSKVAEDVLDAVEQELKKEGVVQ